MISNEIKDAVGKAFNKWK